MKLDLTRIARPSGTLAMVAVDQREALRGMFAPFQTSPVEDFQLTRFKVDVARELSPFASALLVDQEFGLDAILEQGALAPHCGLIAATDLLLGPSGSAANDTDIDRAIDPMRMVSIGAAGLKFLIFWRIDESVEKRAELVAKFNKLCKISGLPSIIEIIVRQPNDSSISFDREEQLIQAAKEASSWKPDLYKAEVPFHGEGDAARITRNAERISEAIGGPWVVLSNGVTASNFASAVEACARGGASGFLAGRAVWADIVGADNTSEALRQVSIPRLKKLGEIVDQYAKPWSSWNH